MPQARPQPRPRGPEPERLKIDLPVGEGLRRLVNAPPITKAEDRAAVRKAKRERAKAR